MNRRAGAAQRGMATLFTTIVLMFGASLVWLFANRNAINEQRLSANEVRAKQAFAAANAGVEHALAHMRNGGIFQSGGVGADSVSSVTLTNAAASAAGTLSSYRTVYCNVDPNKASLPACPATPPAALSCGAVAGVAGTPLPPDTTRTYVVACGWSDDNTSVQRVVQMLQGSVSTAGTVATPVVSRGAANLLTGGASIFNYFNDLTVWSGGALMGQSNTGKTFVRDIATTPAASDSQDSNNNGSPDYRDIGNSPGCNNPPTGYGCSTQGSTFGHDTIGADTRLSTLSTDAFFQTFFGKTPTTYRDEIATYKVDLNNSLSGENSSSISSVNGLTDKVIWIAGDTTLPATIGTQDHPVIVIVDGNATLGSNTVINGMLYVKGNLDSTGTPTVYGSLIVGGAANTTGNLKVVYDPKVLGAVHNLGPAGRVPGGFRDW